MSTCYRCGTTIEPLLSLQWFMDMKRLVKPAIAAVEDGRVRFVPARWGEVYLDWMSKIRPWCVSRQLWWGHRIPAYFCEECDHIMVAELPPATCDRCGGPVRHEEDVLDTWFSSQLWPFATLGWPEETDWLRAFYPDHRALDCQGHHLPVGGPDDHDGPRVHGGRSLQRRHHPPDGAGRRRTSHEQEPGHRGRSARIDRRLRDGCDTLRSCVHELGPGRPLQRGTHRDGEELRQ